ncbi:class I SAM-dependent methyltransferase [Saccharomonospora glauca]|jgi:SAM-dependent methyltransferase|uniref:Methyltransferase family protein n=1 Tax=Saccharomonospora glauca K62 TaxID=928724 RepID=I1CWL8_9PSEU|nr:methyltransferase domain-containing protein [Saccharomonospora glauca]EIE97092.1 methyltransferase family protein [Saccharomonospora glauca K62]
MTISSPNPDTVDLDEARQLVERVNGQGGTYHRLDFGDGLVIEGDYDMSKYLAYYHLPERLDGKTVLDVGTASGFFAIEAERRGAKVTAIDIWDETALPAELARTFKLGLNYVQKDLYDLDASFGQFDLVICGSLLLHLPDPVGALRALRSVTKERLIVSSAATADSATTDQPVCHFTGARASESDYWSYWAFSACALERMLLAADFSRIADVEHFDLKSEPGRMEFSTPHVSMSAYV